MLRRVKLKRADVLEERSDYIIRVARISELGTTLAVSSNRSTLQRNTVYSIYVVFFCSVHRLLITANVVPSSRIIATLMMEGTRSSQTSVLTRATRRNITEDCVLPSHRREDLNSYIVLIAGLCSGDVMCYL
jgi:hypothetical protein